MKRALLVVLLLVGCGDRTVTLPPTATTALHRLSSAPLGGASVRHPTHADGVTEIESEDRAVAIAVTLLGARHAPLLAEGGALRARDALPQGDLIRGYVEGGAEDFVVLRDAAEERRIAYEIRFAKGVAGVRLVNDTFEVIDSRGTPALRVAPPWLVDAGDRRHAAHLRLSGCTYDQRLAPSLPVDPRSDRCTLHVEWPKVALPALLDPGFASTGSMSFARQSHGAIRLASGKVLVVGGGATTCELYDPSTKTWSATGAISTDRRLAPLIATSGARVLVIGGFGTSTAEIYDPSTGAWTATTSMPTRRDMLAAVMLPTGKVLVAGGGVVDALGVVSVEPNGLIYDPATATWSATGAHVHPRVDGRAIALASGKVWFGTGKDTTGSITDNELYDPATNTWTASGSLVYPREEAIALPMPDGKIFVSSGSDTEIVDPIAGAVLGPSAKRPRFAARGAILPDGKILITGGREVFLPTPLPPSLVFDPVSRTLRESAIPIGIRSEHTATTLADGRVLVAGGNDISKKTSTAELYDRGMPCTTSADCGEGHCTDGVCCESSCDSQCEQCALAPWKGFCAATPKGSPPAGVRAACGSGVCAGACGGYERLRCTVFPDASTSCGAATCADASHASSASFCSGSGVCAAPMVADCGAYGCSTGVCKSSCTTTADCAPGFGCVGSSCQKGVLGAACVTAAECVSGSCVDGTCCSTGACTAPMRCDVVGHKGSCSLPLGSTCTKADDCGSGFCVDAVCCDSPCAGQCEACGATGACAAVVGAPRGDRAACAGAGVCAGSCDGVSREACSFPGSSLACSDASCTDGFEHTASACDGAGTCALSASRRCEPFACGAGACLGKCATDVDCATGYSCDARSGRCVFGAKCDGDHSVLVPGARPIDCAPYRCAGNKCLTRCASSDDCLAGMVCDVVAGTCNAPPTDDSGGGCATGHGAKNGLVLGLLVALCAALRRNAQRG